MDISVWDSDVKMEDGDYWPVRVVRTCELGSSLVVLWGGP